jgi:hypothetical protein
MFNADRLQTLVGRQIFVPATWFARGFDAEAVRRNSNDSSNPNNPNFKG